MLDGVLYGADAWVWSIPGIVSPYYEGYILILSSGVSTHNGDSVSLPGIAETRLPSLAVAASTGGEYATPYIELRNIAVLFYHIND